jgi:hypothetical protein
MKFLCSRQSNEAVAARVDQRGNATMQVLTMLLPVFLAFAFLSFKLFNSLRRMEIQMGMGVVLLRYESPSLFWFVIAFQCLLIGALLALIYVPFFVLPNQIMS